MINVTNKDVALRLSILGFKYRQDLVANQPAFIFVENPELLKVLNEKFSSRDFFISRTMNF